MSLRALRPYAPALEDITFRVEAGEFVVLTGPSGAGKTTLLRFCMRRSGRIVGISSTVAMSHVYSAPDLRVSTLDWHRLSRF